MKTAQFFLLRLAILLAAMLAAAPAGFAQPVHDAKHHWSFQPPASWHAVGQESIDLVNREASSRLPGKNFTYISGYTADPSGQLVYPYILIQRTDVPMKGRSYTDIAKAVKGKVFDKKVGEVKDALEDIGELQDLGAPAVDPATNRLSFNMKMEVAGIGPVKGRCVAFFSKDGMIQLNGYDLEEKFAEFLPVFEQSLASFAFDPGFQFVESKRPSGAVVGGAAGAMTSVIVVLAATARKRAKAKAAAEGGGDSPGGATPS